MRRFFLATLIIVGLLAVSLLPLSPKLMATPVYASSHQATLSTTTRASILTNALTWVDANVPYNQNATYQGYREDCSGFVSMAWGLPTPGLTTDTLPTVASQIAKDDLQPGDVINKPLAGNAGHVLIFDRWTDSSHTSYNGYDETGDGLGTHFARNIPYPYWSNTDGYVPLRRNNLSVTTLLQFEVALLGISANTGAGDNNQPIHARQSLYVQIYNTSNQLVASPQSTVLYNRGTAGYTDVPFNTPGHNPGSFMGLVDLGTSWLPGYYYFKVRLLHTLWWQDPHFYPMANGAATSVQMTPAVSGDINGDNKLDISDYNILVSCFGSKTCPSDQKDASDLNENGKVEGGDYNTFELDLQCSWCH